MNLDIFLKKREEVVLEYNKEIIRKQKTTSERIKRHIFNLEQERVLMLDLTNIIYYEINNKRKSFTQNITDKFKIAEELSERGIDTFRFEQLIQEEVYNNLELIDSLITSLINRVIKSRY